MPGFVGFPELLLLGLVVLLVFGPKRLPEMGRSMGKGLREFKDSISASDHHGDETTRPTVIALEGDPLEDERARGERDKRVA
jgi:sec-independent protein translocase protein TatA